MTFFHQGSLIVSSVVHSWFRLAFDSRLTPEKVRIKTLNAVNAEYGNTEKRKPVKSKGRTIKTLQNQSIKAKNSQKKKDETHSFELQ